MSVLICYDGSPSAKVAVVSAAAMFDQAVFPEGDGVTLLHVWNGPMPATDSFNYKDDPDAPSDDRLVDVAERGAQATIEEGRGLAVGHRLVLDTLIVRNESSVSATILRVAEEQDSSLIVLGAHPHGTPGPTLDRVSTAVIAGSTRPVLVIPMTGADKASVLAAPHQDAIGARTPQSVVTT